MYPGLATGYAGTNGCLVVLHSVLRGGSSSSMYEVRYIEEGRFDREGDLPIFFSLQH